MSSLDEIIRIYAREIDVTLIDEALRRTPEERLRALEDAMAAHEELRAAMERALDEDR